MNIKNIKDKVDNIKIPEYKLKKEDVDKLLNYATKVPSKAQEIRKETARRITTAITAAFAFVIALAWKDAIRSSIDSIVLKMGVPSTVYFYEFIIAFVITLVCVLGIMLTSKYGVKKESK
tara:strand:+ start:471 stop:830 length:360 start_codon:yes stop_codon:yes gene_type:complete